MPINTLPLISKALSVRGWASGHAIDCEDTIKFAMLHGINCLVEKFPLEQYQQAYDAMMSGKVRFRAVIVME